MKATDSFKAIIQSHLEGVAEKDPLFAETLKKPAKNIDDCITYILNTVQKSGCNGFADEEIFNMAIHYYDEDDIAVGKPINARVVVNHQQEAIRKSFSEPLKTDKPKQVKPVKKPEPTPASQFSLF